MESTPMGIFIATRNLISGAHDCRFYYKIGDNFYDFYVVKENLLVSGISSGRKTKDVNYDEIRHVMDLTIYMFQRIITTPVLIITKYQNYLFYHR